MRLASLPWRSALLGAVLVLAAGPAAPARAERGPIVGCQSSGHTSRVDIGSPVVLGVVPQVLLGTVLLVPCGGPLYVHAAVTVVLEPGPSEGAAVVASVRVTCAAGCPGIGVVVAPIPGSDAFANRDGGLTAGPPGVTTIPLLAVFPDLPAGTYLVEMTALGGHTLVVQAQLHAFGHGAAGGAGRAGSP